MTDDDALDAEIERLLADPAHAGHPLRAALEKLYRHSREQLDRLERIARISDGYQAMSQARHQSLAQRYDKQLRQLERLTRISDRYQQSMRELNLALEDASTHDPLTGLANRRLLLQQLRAEGERAQRHQRPLTVAMVDVDHFKRINDRHGHDAGDRVLVAIGRTLSEHVRSSDLCGRWGGEEFLVLLPETGADEARAVMQRVLAAIGALAIDVDHAAVHATASVGLATLQSGESIDDALKRADDALLGAKRAGRNRVM